MTGMRRALAQRLAHTRAMRRRPRGERAFTLVEVIASLAIVAIVLPVAMNGLSIVLRLGQDARCRAQAASFARGKLDDLVATGDWQGGVMGGEFTPASEANAGVVDGPVFKWSASVRPWTQSSVNELSIDVSWTAGKREHVITLTTLVDPNTAALQ